MTMTMQQPVALPNIGSKHAPILPKCEPRRDANNYRKDAIKIFNFVETIIETYQPFPFVCRLLKSWNRSIDWKHPATKCLFPATSWSRYFINEFSLALDQLGDLYLKFKVLDAPVLLLRNEDTTISVKMTSMQVHVKKDLIDSNDSLRGGDQHQSGESCRRRLASTVALQQKHLLDMGTARGNTSFSNRFDFQRWITCLFVVLFFLSDFLVCADAYKDCSSSSTSAIIFENYAYCRDGEYLCDPYANIAKRGCEVSKFFPSVRLSFLFCIPFVI